MEEVFREKDKGVSAIVGTILIVAITVVLAATVYGVLTGFGGLISGGAPTGAIQVSSSSSTYTITFSQLASNVSLSNVQVKLTNTNSTPVTVVAAFGTYGVAIDSGSTSSGTLSISSVITITGMGTLSSISIMDTSPSGTIASWSS